jgi:hypothetical protein
VPVLSATDCVTPAFHHTTQQMFRNFRFSFWLRIAILGLFTGEFAGEGFHGNFPSSFPSHPASAGHAGAHAPFPWHPGWFTMAHVVPLVLGVVAVMILLTLIFLYISSTLRFVLFNAVLFGDPHIRSGWRRWRETGRKFLVWQLILAFAGWMLLIGFLLIPLLVLFPKHIGFWHIDATAIVTLGLGFFALMVTGLAMAIVSILAKDFVVPIMALQSAGWQEGWRRFLAIARGHASEYVIYFLMKIVLRIGAGIAHGIIMFLFAMLIAVPVVIAVIAGVAVGAGATMVVKALLITIGIVMGLIVLTVFIALSAFTGAPIAFFFPAYSIYFFAGRYEPLGRIVFPAPPAPPAPPPVFAPEAPPMPA